MPHTHPYAMISPATERYHSGPPFAQYGAQGQFTTTWLTPKLIKPHPDVMCTGPRSHGEKKRREKQKSSKVIMSPYLYLRIYTPPTILTGSFYIYVYAMIGIIRVSVSNLCGPSLRVQIWVQVVNKPEPSAQVRFNGTVPTSAKWAG
jgi:hypothetical protein